VSQTQWYTHHLWNRDEQHPAMVNMTIAALHTYGVNFTGWIEKGWWAVGCMVY